MVPNGSQRRTSVGWRASVVKMLSGSVSPPGVRSIIVRTSSDHSVRGSGVRRGRAGRDVMEVLLPPLAGGRECFRRAANAGTRTGGDGLLPRARRRGLPPRGAGLARREPARAGRAHPPRRGVARRGGRLPARLAAAPPRRRLRRAPLAPRVRPRRGAARVARL